MKKRILSAILALLTVIGLVPATVLAASAGSTDTASGSSTLDAMIAQNSTAPQGFDTDNLSPYGTKVGEVFTLMENSELFTYTTANINVDGTMKSFKYENYKDGTISDDTDFSSSNTSYYMESNGNILSYTQAVAFDPTGCGLRNYIAFVGYNYDSGCAEVWFSKADSQGTVLYQDFTTTEGRVPLKVKLWDCSWFKNANNYGIDTVDSKNFFQITAGDYNNDGYDTICCILRLWWRKILLQCHGHNGRTYRN